MLVWRARSQPHTMFWWIQQYSPTSEKIQGVGTVKTGKDIEGKGQCRWLCLLFVTAEEISHFVNGSIGSVMTVSLQVTPNWMRHSHSTCSSFLYHGSHRPEMPQPLQVWSPVLAFSENCQISNTSSLPVQARFYLRRKTDTYQNMKLSSSFLKQGCVSF